MFKRYLKKLDFPNSYISITLGFLVVIIGGILIYNNLISKPQEQKEDLDQILEQKAVEVIPSLPTTHTVNINENLWKIAERYYKSGYNWVSVANENKLINADRITVGQKLSIPKADVIKPEKNILASAIEEVKEYKVIQGDSLWKIAVREYSDGFVWTKIAQYNKLTNPDLIYPGNILKLPR